jgi:hypothetical protein
MENKKCIQNNNGNAEVCVGNMFQKGPDEHSEEGVRINAVWK